MPFEFQPLEVPGPILVQAKVFTDPRGWFREIYKHRDFASAGIVETFVQDNHSYSVRGVLRGLHYQKHPREQAKLISVMRGEIFDVVVDIRNGSPTRGRWASAVLSEQNARMLYVPVGFAHGFCTLSDEADVVYKVTTDYAPEHEGGILWNDPEIGIAWPIRHPILSAEDAGLPELRRADHDFVYEGYLR